MNYQYLAIGVDVYELLLELRELRTTNMSHRCAQPTPSRVLR